MIQVLTHLADASAAVSVIRNYVTPVIRGMTIMGSLACSFFLVDGGYRYMTSSGKPENLQHAKRIITNALIGLVVIAAAATLTALLSHEYSNSGVAIGNQLPMLNAIKPQPVSNGLVDVIIKAITGVLNNIIQSAAQPFLKALSFFTTATPLVATNAGVFNLWLVVAGIADTLFVLVIGLLGFQIMSFSSLGLEELDFKRLLPQLAFIFVLINSSIFIIDGIISLSNILITAIRAAFGSVTVWSALTQVVKQTGGLGLATLLIMIVFLILSVILLVYYVGRIVTLYIGAVLAPLTLLLWLIPGFRDFSESAFKAYLTTIFVLFIHVIILQLAASLFSGLALSGLHDTPNTLMALVVGLATLVALLKTQGVMMQLSYVSVGPKTARRLGGQFLNGVNYFAAGSSIALDRALTGKGLAKFNNAAYTSNGAKALAFTIPGKPQSGPIHHPSLDPKPVPRYGPPMPKTAQTVTAPRTAASKKAKP